MDTDFNQVETSTLFVGEGDFSFSADYIKIKNELKENIYATCLSSDSLTERQLDNIKIIERNGGFVYIDVDATCLEYHPVIKDLKFTKIIFNFPHIPGKMNIRENRKLVQQFFISAEKVLTSNGTVWINLCQGQGGTEIEKIKRKWCDSWQIVSLAASASLILRTVKPFDAKCFTSYKCTGFRGLQKPFNLKGALTHVFCRGKTVGDIYLNDECVRNAMSVEMCISNFKRLHKKIHNDQLSPSSKVLLNLNALTKKIFTCNQVSVDDLMICKNVMPFLNIDLNESTALDCCEGCVSNLVDYVLNERNTDCIISVVYNICCIKNIDINNHPFCHILSYFCDNAEIIHTSLLSILDYFNYDYFNNTNHELLSTGNTDLHFKSKQIIEIAANNIQLHCGKKVKNVLNIYASFSKNEGDESHFYSNVRCFLSCDDLVCNKNELIKIGNVIKYYDSFKVYTCILLNLDHLASLKFHVMDYRIFLTRDSYFMPQMFCDYLQEVYRSPSIYPPTYEHDTSFYIEKDFCEKNFFLIIRNTVGLLIKSIKLIDSYFDNELQKFSRCYRFIYQSCHLALTKEKANIIHTQVMRRSLERSLNICLR